MCKTNPIPGDAGWDEAPGAGDAGANAQNEANLPGGTGWDGAWGTGDAVQMRKTNPISRGRDIPPFQYFTIAVFQSDADCTKRSQFARWCRAALPRPSTLRPRPCQGACAKRTQFPALPGGTRPWGLRRGANAQNEPNFADRDEERTCKTNPISPCPGPAARRAPEKVGLPTPNLRKAGLCKTNPISPTATRSERAKRTQFRPVRDLRLGEPRRKSGSRRPTYEKPDCAKRSQFGPA